jgi:outer membrane autotransporter protein
VHPLGFGTPPGEGRLAIWLDGQASFGELEDGANPKAYDYELYGPLLGFDGRFGEHLTAGLFAGYARTSWDTWSDTAEGTANSYHGGLYLGLAWPRFYALLAGRYARSDMQTERSIAFGSVDRLARGDFDGNEYGAALEAGCRLASAGPIEIEPIGSLLYDRVETDSFTESGAGSIDLDVDVETVDSLVSDLGLRLSTRGSGAEGFFFAPQLRATWEHEWGDQERGVNARFAGAAGGFAVVGAAPPRDRAVLGIGWEVGFPQGGVSLALYYDVRVAADFLENSVAVGARVRW